MFLTYNIIGMANLISDQLYYTKYIIYKQKIVHVFRKSGPQMRRTGLGLILWKMVIECVHYEIQTNSFLITIVRKILVSKSVKE